jgi:cytochrome c oxidase subunit 2
MKRAASALLLFLAGCRGVQSSAVRDGAHSALIGRLFDVFLVTTVVVYVLVMAYLALAVWRGRRHRTGGGLQGEPAYHLETGWRSALVAFASVTALILFGLSLATWFTDRGLARAGAQPEVNIELTGHQWWWDVRYKDAVSSRAVHTANEIHIPVGQTTRITLKSDDVIHSLWIPNLAGKQDLIPGREADLVLHPLHTGVFRAQCAEFCGIQHAKMALDVTVDSPADYYRWYEAQVKAPVPPASGPALIGYALFQNRQCASCHAVAGTPASGTVGPDLSHVASRRTIAAGTLPTTHANFLKWIEDPQKPKPGNNMPKVPLSSNELAALTAYVETLR